MVNKKKWEKTPKDLTGGGNYILRPSNKKKWTEYAISYQPDQYFCGAFFKTETEQGETALCDYRTEDFDYYILNGDWRKQYEKVIDKGFNTCLQVYLKNKKKHGSKSWGKK